MVIDKIDHSDVPIRLFKSDFMEFFTHISPIAVLVIWLPIILYFLVSSIITPVLGANPLYIPLTFIGGLLAWSFFEYTLHRFVFHFHTRSPIGKRITFLFHGVHHAQPQCKTRLVMPPVVSLPLAAILYGLFYLILGVLLAVSHWIAPSFAGTLLGYVLYDMTHYATHHFAMRSGYLRYLKRYHMRHHYKTPNALYGVTSPVWDYIFGTSPK